MNFFDRNDETCVKNKKKIEKCYRVWENIICKGSGCSKEEIKKSVAKKKRERERLLSILYGSVFRGKKYLLYSRKWRGKTLNEIINQDKKNYMNLKNLKNVDNTYFCKLAIGYVDQGDKNYFKKMGESEYTKCYDSINNANAVDNPSRSGNKTNGNNTSRNNASRINASRNNASRINASRNNASRNNASRNNASRNNASRNNASRNNASRNSANANANNASTNNAGSINAGSVNAIDNSHLHSNASARKTLSNLNSGGMGNKRKAIQVDKNAEDNNKEEVYERLNYLEKRSHRNKLRTENNNNNNNSSVNKNNNSNLNNNPNCTSNNIQNDSKSNEENCDDSKVIKYKYLPTGVFYSRVSRSFIANWIDDKTKKQIKMPYKIAEFGVEKCMILAILSRNLRISNLNNSLKYYDNLTADQKEKMLQAIRTTQKSEKLFNDILKPNSKDTPNATNNGSPPQATSSIKKNSDTELKNVPVKKSVIDKKKVKQTNNNSEKLPTGVYFYQGSYVANWWETNKKKQYKVPFKISEYGMTRAKNLAIISRLIRSSSAQEVNLILTQMEENKSISKLNYATISSLAFKYVKPPPTKE
ncbi:hypothetical protein POVWA1_040530 [Plasmodium ovale wallikeri]|uniref:Transcription factor with AP2 domain(S), putative n=2 Tax=Plasmodium ovale TaxID=36330 RepID=A0A1C3KUV8_PLAOA|nr:hypothetical protein POVWA1_040530 [Plasmodium ovale wallikeri]SBT77925.1 transcription factor with AP2 domain(s), putative [Plasmodium ovale]